MDDLSPGLSGEARRTVTPEMTASALGSGDVPVLGTPGLLALMEEAAVAALRGNLPEGRTSVGARVTLEHIAPTRLGAEVCAVARLVAVEGRRLRFECEAFEGDKPIGHAAHERVVVDREAFGRLA